MNIVHFLLLVSTARPAQYLCEIANKFPNSLCFNPGHFPLRCMDDWVVFPYLICTHMSHCGYESSQHYELNQFTKGRLYRFQSFVCTQSVFLFTLIFYLCGFSKRLLPNCFSFPHLPPLYTCSLMCSL